MITQLSYVQPLFLEQQNAGRTFPRAPYIVGSIALGFILIVLGILIVRPSLPAIAFLPGLLIGAFTTGLAAMMFRFTSAVTIVEPSAVQLRMTIFGLRIWRRTIAIEQIQNVDLFNEHGSIATLKWAVGELNFMTRGQCVRLHMGKYNYIHIGSETPEQLRDAVRGALEMSGRDTRP